MASYNGKNSNSPNLNSNSNFSIGKTPNADSLNIFDPNAEVPSEPPPSYDEAMGDPSVDLQDSPSSQYQRPLQRPPQRLPPRLAPPIPSQGYNRPPGVPPSNNPNTLQVPGVYQTHSHTSSTSSSISNSSSSYTRPVSPLPSKSSSNLPKPTPTNPNPYLPWRYPSSYRCKKCENTGFKKKNGHACKSCWKHFRPRTTPPQSQRDLEFIINSSKHPKPINNNVVKLPPGSTAVSANPTLMPTVVQPGDPRIGGVLCPRCNGKGMKHDFLNVIRCNVCNGLGRVGFNGRPL